MVWRLSSEVPKLFKNRNNQDSKYESNLFEALLAFIISLVNTLTFFWYRQIMWTVPSCFCLLWLVQWQCYFQREDRVIRLVIIITTFPLLDTYRSCYFWMLFNPVRKWKFRNNGRLFDRWKKEMGNTSCTFKIVVKFVSLHWLVVVYILTKWRKGVLNIDVGLWDASSSVYVLHIHSIDFPRWPWKNIEKIQLGKSQLLTHKIASLLST